jgi:hypothetical protein
MAHAGVEAVPRPFAEEKWPLLSTAESSRYFIFI